MRHSDLEKQTMVDLIRLLAYALLGVASYRLWRMGGILLWVNIVMIIAMDYTAAAARTAVREAVERNPTVAKLVGKNPYWIVALKALDRSAEKKIRQWTYASMVVTVLGLVIAVAGLVKSLSTQ